ncbi:hypothetical protein I545_2826 [Mycobacterium kansasii 662]|uniref:Uncharacterized protein n=2 Tax=Mycobacterium kansasii TaxID=1768 RepID=A0A1V3WNH6_MYCKA|nr:hypothetical protein I545_2826 [Mycobacterium kansasii 662]OOK67986.1 hypothetical protein BZL29_6752 [Mycobacterium kansasii]
MQSGLAGGTSGRLIVGELELAETEAAGNDLMQREPGLFDEHRLQFGPGSSHSDGSL